MQLSPYEQELVRSRPQSTELYMTIFQPKTVMACRPTGTLVRGSREIGYYDVSTGSISSIEAGMTLLVGTTPGGRELGKIRLRSGTSSQFIVSENGHIDWPSAQYLTVQRYWEVWPVYPRIISDPLNDENVIFYKDYDVPYTNQNSILGAFPCAGPEIRGAFAGEQLYWSATGTTHLVGSGLTYEWTFEGGTPTGSTSHTPGWVTYPQAGDYVTRLKVSGANGSIDTTYRYVTIRDRFESSGSKKPLRGWTLSNLSGSRGQGGLSANVTIINQDVQINDGDIVLFWSDDWYGNVNQSLGGNSPNNEKVFYVGHVTDGSISYNYKDSSVSFQIASISEIMRKSEGFSVSVESKASPSTWFELLDMDSRRAIYHYLKWHSTVLSVADVRWVGTDKPIQFFDSDRASLFDAIDNYMRGTLPGEFVADRQGMLWAEVNPVAYTNPTGSFLPEMEITRRDWMNEPTITERKIIPLSYLEMGGIAYSGPTTGTFTAHIAAAPSSVPHVRGSVERKQGLALTGQSQLNTLVGHDYARRIFKYPSISMDLAGNYRNLDIAPQRSLDINVQASDTSSGITLHQPYTLEGISWNYDPINKLLLPSINLNVLVNGPNGETITIPDIPENGGYGDFGGALNFSGFSMGAFPPLLSSLSNNISGGWKGTYAADAVINTSFAINSSLFNYGFTTPGTAPVSGVYLLTSIISHYDSNTVEAIVFFPGFSAQVPPQPSIGIPIAIGDIVSYTTMVVAVAGESLLPYVQSNTTVYSGAFNLFATLLYRI